MTSHIFFQIIQGRRLWVDIDESRLAINKKLLKLCKWKFVK